MKKAQVLGLSDAANACILLEKQGESVLHFLAAILESIDFTLDALVQLATAIGCYDLAPHCINLKCVAFRN